MLIGKQLPEVYNVDQLIYVVDLFTKFISELYVDFRKWQDYIIFSELRT